MNKLKYLCKKNNKISKIMRKTLFIIAVLVPMLTFAQNFQVHYDLGKNRNYVTTTFEMFKLDKWGNTFMFVDFDYNMDKENHPSMAYMEIARCFTLGKSPLSAHVEYNGGLLASPSPNGNLAFAINNAYLAGLDYGWNSEDFNKFLNFKVLYKYIQGKNPHSFQLTGVWTLHFLDKKMTFNGFADFWKEDNLNFTNAKGESIMPTETQFVFLSEPQLWYNFTSNFSLGTEVELGSNFGTVKGMKVCPTIGAKWTF